MLLQINLCDLCGVLPGVREYPLPADSQLFLEKGQKNLSLCPACACNYLDELLPHISGSLVAEYYAKLLKPKQIKKEMARYGFLPEHESSSAV
jgi:hypothetical protein